MNKLFLYLFLCLYSATLLGQNITNTLGTNGSFLIKDGSSTFLTLDQATGRVDILRNLRLENTTNPDLGVIFKGSQRFIHTFGANNTFIGINSGNFTTTGTYNSAMGDQSLFSITTGNYNAAFGVNTLFSNTTGERNTALGIGSLYANTSGNYNTAIGNGSLSSNIVGAQNTALGNQSLSSNTEGVNNLALGYQALSNNTTGDNNVSTGAYSLNSNTTGGANTAVGEYSLLYNNGDINTAIGNYSGSTITVGGNLTCIGYNAQPTSGDVHNQITLGNGDITSLRCNVQSISSLSDARDKKNIKDLDLGIDFLLKLKPRLYNWDKREWYANNKSDGSKMKKEPTAGFIAQELDSVQTSERAGWLNLVLKDNPEKWEATPGNLLPIIVKAIQDLKKENNELQVVNNKLKASNTELTSRLNKFEEMQNILAAEIQKIKTNGNESSKVSLGEK